MTRQRFKYYKATTTRLRRTKQQQRQRLVYTKKQPFTNIRNVARRSRSSTPQRYTAEDYDTNASDVTDENFISDDNDDLTDPNTQCNRISSNDNNDTVSKSALPFGRKSILRRQQLQQNCRFCSRTVGFANNDLTPLFFETNCRHQSL